MKHKFYSHREKIISLVKTLNIEFIDMTGYFDSLDEPLDLFHGHYNAKGYALVAQKIEEQLK